MPMPLEIAAYCDELLHATEFDDYCPNGLQVDAARDVARLVTGVTASQAAIEAAVAADADMLLVHHGYFWKGEPAPLVGMKGRRIRTLFGHGVSLLAYHLPLDAHPELGNNAQLGHRLGVHGGPVGGDGLLWGGQCARASAPRAIADRLGEALQRQPLLIAGGEGEVRRIAWCTGAAQGYIERAAALGYDMFISGEISEQTVHSARELGIHYLSAGHHATERYGVQVLGQEIADHFGIQHQYVEIANPV